MTSCEVSFVNALTKSLSIGNSRRLSVSRLLSSEILSLSYVFDIDVDCSAAGCNVASISEALQNAAAQDLNAALQSGQFMDRLGAGTGNATAIISGEVTLDDSTCDNSQTTGGSTSGTVLSSEVSSVWYPSWGGEDKCTNKPGMPQYMRGNSHYHSSALSACCKKHFHWDVSGCVVASGGDVAKSGTEEWYINWGVFRCHQSCIKSSSQDPSLNCGGIADGSDVLFTSVEECCTTMVPWIAKHICVGESSPPYQATGTGKWYVSYFNQKCIKDCLVEESPSCGGVNTESGVEMFASSQACCSTRLWWVGQEDCT